jgi:hypothetical protein
MLLDSREVLLSLQETRRKDAETAATHELLVRSRRKREVPRGLVLTSSLKK